MFCLCVLFIVPLTTTAQDADLLDTRRDPAELSARFLNFEGLPSIADPVPLLEIGSTDQFMLASAKAISLCGSPPL
jgi:hypothetical protein